jgi:hypothetical protein
MESSIKKLQTGRDQILIWKRPNYKKFPTIILRARGTFIPIGNGQMFHWKRPFFNLVAAKF